MIIQGTTGQELDKPTLVNPASPAEPQLPWPRLAAVVLLAGSVRPSQLRKASGRCGLELPVASKRVVMDCWLDELIALTRSHGLDRLAVRVMVDRMTSMQSANRDVNPLALSIEQDPSEYRGTAGLLHDSAKSYDDDDFMLVGHASQLLFVSLAELADRMMRSQADFSMICSSDGTPAGLMLIRCGCLRSINPIGFVDLNEQALPTIAKRYDVRVVRYDQPPTRTVRTRSSYIQTLRQLHRQGSLAVAVPGLEEDWHPTFGLVEEGSYVHDQAIVHDSVVLSGARIEAGVVLVRSVVCSGAVVRKGQSVIDTVLDGGLKSIGSDA